LAAIYSVPAKRDLLEIWIYIAEDNMDAADATERRIRGFCDKLAKSPGMEIRGRISVQIFESLEWAIT
jgi:plasmid stabilization system protein ParE